MKDLDFGFISDFEYYLKTQKRQKQVTINKALQRFKKMVEIAIEAKIIEVFPFNEHKPKTVKNQIVYLL